MRSQKELDEAIEVTREAVRILVVAAAYDDGSLDEALTARLAQDVLEWANGRSDVPFASVLSGLRAKLPRATVQ